MALRYRSARRTGLIAVLLGVGLLVATTVGGAAPATVGLGTAGSFAVLAGTGVTNTGPTVLDGDLGTCPTPAITGFTGPPAGSVNGTTHAADAAACQAQADLTIAYDDAAGRAPTTTYPGPTDLGGKTLAPGVYTSPSSFAITGTLTLDAQGDPDAVFIFQAGSTLVTAPNSKVVLINGAQACNVFWQVGSSATLGVGSTFAGTILALTSITANTNAEVQGRLLARNGAVTLDSDRVTVPPCLPPTTSTSTTVATSTSTTVASTTTTSSSTSTTAPATTTSTSSTTSTSTSTSAPATTTTTIGPATTTTTIGPATTTTAVVPATTSTTPGPATTTSTSTTVTPGGGAGGGSGGGEVTTIPPATTTSTTSTVPGAGARTPESGAAGSGGGTVAAGGGGTTSATVAPAQPARAQAAGTLALTGASVGPWELAAALSLALGGPMVLLAGGRPSRRRRTSGET